MSKIEVDQVDPQSGTTLTLGTSGDTVSIPSGVTLANNGTATGFAAIDWQSTIVTGATHTASANQGIWINTTSNACTLTLPGSPSVGDQLIFSDFARTWGSNAVTLTLNGSKFQGFTSPAPVYDTEGETVHIVYSGSTQGWIPINDGAVANETPQPYSAEYLVIAGGGAGGSDHGGGGGAGGLLTNFGGTAITLSGGQTYTATVGSGGAGSTSASAGASGNNSVLSGSGISTVTSTGGGGGGRYNGVAGLAGGSGGGGGAGNGAAGSGTSPQGNDGGTGGAYSAPHYSGAGGGGAGAVGTNGGAQPDGGAGSSNSITGSAVNYAGGGGGVSDGTPGSGGTGGGGAAGKPGAGTSGTANTGGGGGGTQTPNTTGSGGSGVVILRVATADYSGTTTGSPTVTTDGSDTIIKFTGDGTYTA
jgi:hypothetical protein